MNTQTVGYKAKEFELRNLTFFFLLAWGLPLFFAALFIFGIVRWPSQVGPGMIILLVVLNFAPMIAAFVVTGITEGKPGVRALWKRFWNRNLSIKWLLVALLLNPAIRLVASLVNRTLEGCQRAKKLDAAARAFLVEQPNGVVLHLGCGLDSRFWRVDNGQVEWYDLDMPPVIELRQRFYADNERYHLSASSVTDLEWVDRVAAAGRPVLAVAEGLLMYMGEADVRRLLLRLQEAFPGCRLIADVFSRLTARSATRHPSLKQTGASIGWGIDDPREVEGWAQGIHLLEEWYFTQDPDLDRLSLGYRLAYRLAGTFNMVRRAHRIVYYQL